MYSGERQKRSKYANSRPILPQRAHCVDEVFRVRAVPAGLVGACRRTIGKSIQWFQSIGPVICRFSLFRSFFSWWVSFCEKRLPRRWKFRSIELEMSIVCWILSFSFSRVSAFSFSLLHAHRRPFITNLQRKVRCFVVVGLGVRCTIRFQIPFVFTQLYCSLFYETFPSPIGFVWSKYAYQSPKQLANT